MPAILTHYTFAIAHLNGIADKEAFLLGNQGPDTFMAYGTNPFRKRKDYQKIRPFGGFMHQSHIEDYYVSMLEYASPSPHKEMLFSYIEGLFAHYAVDRNCHPYIFFRSGFDQNGELHGFYAFNHGKFEAIVDKLLTKKRGTFIKPRKAIAIAKSKVIEISKMWHAAAPDILDGEAFLRAYQDFVFAEKMLYTPTGLKRPLFRMMGKYSTAYAQSCPRFLKKYHILDLLNEGHNPWKDPATFDIHNESFEDLLLLSSSDLAEIRPTLLEAMKEGADFTDIKRKIAVWSKNINHDGTPFGEKKRDYVLCWSK